MTRLPHPSAVLFGRDVARLTRFYQSVAAMTFVSGDDAHSVLELAGFQLVVHALTGEPAPLTNASGRVPARDDAYVKICLPVESLAAARGRAAGLDGVLYPPEREWQARGFRACDGSDPEGNVFQLRENART